MCKLGLNDTAVEICVLGPPWLECSAGVRSVLDTTWLGRTGNAALPPLIPDGRQQTKSGHFDLSRNAPSGPKMLPSHRLGFFIWLGSGTLKNVRWYESDRGFWGRPDIGSSGSGRQPGDSRLPNLGDGTRRCW